MGQDAEYKRVQNTRSNDNSPAANIGIWERIRGGDPLAAILSCAGMSTSCSSESTIGDQRAQIEF